MPKPITQQEQQWLKESFSGAKSFELGRGSGIIVTYDHSKNVAANVNFLRDIQLSCFLLKTISPLGKLIGNNYKKSMFDYNERTAGECAFKIPLAVRDAIEANPSVIDGHQTQQRQDNVGKLLSSDASMLGKQGLFAEQRRAADALSKQTNARGIQEGNDPQQQENNVAVTNS